MNPSAVPDLVVAQLVKKSEARELALATLKEEESFGSRFGALLAVLASISCGPLLVASQQPYAFVALGGISVAALMGLIHAWIQISLLRKRVNALSLLLLEQLEGAR